jgi:ABC-type antimicrobial peptide transport system permease subunit
VRLTAIGLVCGLGIAAVIARLLGSMLFAVSPVDPLTYGGIALLLLAVGWCAAMGPTRRALGTDPAEVLRHE